MKKTEGKLDKGSVYSNDEVTLEANTTLKPR